MATKGQKFKSYSYDTKLKAIEMTDIQKRNNCSPGLKNNIFDCRCFILQHPVGFCHSGESRFVVHPA
ncbi:MAG: hypothetical protein ACE3L7_10695 [Candidatus Pristimantibacillus sp.]